MQSSSSRTEALGQDAVLDRGRARRAPMRRPPRTRSGRRRRPAARRRASRRPPPAPRDRRGRSAPSTRRGADRVSVCVISTPSASRAMASQLVGVDDVLAGAPGQEHADRDVAAGRRCRARSIAMSGATPLPPPTSSSGPAATRLPDEVPADRPAQLHPVARPRGHRSGRAETSPSSRRSTVIVTRLPSAGVAIE